MKYPGILLTVLAIVLFAISLTTGPADISPWGGLRALLTPDEDPLSLIMREIRLPRAILAAIVGAGLGMAGAAMQGYLRNPLADPGLIGVSGSAALGAVIALQTGLAAAWYAGLPIASLAGATGGVLLVLLLAGPRGSSLTLILAGIAVSAFAGALTSLVLNLSPNPYAANEIVFWMMGSLADRSFFHILIALPLILMGMLFLMCLTRGLDALTLGEDAASAMGINMNRFRLLLIFGTALIVGASTAVAGAIGFIGLVVPHILRPLVCAQPGRLMMISAPGGAVMLMLADIAVRGIAPERDLKLGVLTALIGAPLFLHLIWRTRREVL